MGSNAAEFVNKVNDQVRKKQKRMSNVADSGEEHSIIWWMFMATTLNAVTFMGKNFLDNQNSIMNTTDPTLKKMFDISAKLVGEQDEFSNVDKIDWEKTFMETSVIDWWWNYHQSSTRESLRLFGFCVVSIFNEKVYVFSDSVLCRGNLSQQKRSQGMWTSPNLKRGVFMKKKWRGDRLLIKQVRGNHMHPVNQTAREAQKLKK